MESSRNAATRHRHALTVAAVLAGVIALLFGTAGCAIRPVGTVAPDAPGDRKPPRPAGHADLRILQIGDSHTAADFFTGEARRILQARFGNGGPGYLEAGRPHVGVRNSAVTVSASNGWDYSSLQKSAEPRAFGISGFNATASRAGETLSYSSETPIPGDLVEIEVMVGRGRGGIEVRIDDREPVRHSLAAARPDRLVLKAPVGTPRSLKRLEIRTTDDDPVTVSSVRILGGARGLSYSRAGFPGATVDILNRIDPKVLADDLRRLDPDLVVLAFGTNEGFNDGLDLDRYAARYEEALGKVRAALPTARIVLIAPPHAARVKGGHEGASAKGSDCGRQTPPNLDRVRATVLDIARRQGLAAWDWSSVMPPGCGPARWASADPKLMADDRVHFTKAGYELSARAFAKFLEPMIAQRQR